MYFLFSKDNNNNNKQAEKFYPNLEYIESVMV